jgi:acetaldehyde dehydrogenase/alcohol dehydrogenase
MNVYYGRTFVETEKPDAGQIDSADSSKDFKQAFNRAVSSGKKRV